MAESDSPPGWLEKIWWREAWLTMEAAEAAELPPYLGSGIRGALGHLLRAALCEDSGCGHDCQRPDACRYFSLFERNRQGAKPFVLLAPGPPGLEEVALGGPVHLPFRTRAAAAGEKTPRLRYTEQQRFAPGARMEFGIRLVGCASNALPAVVEAIARHGMRIGGPLFRLDRAVDGGGRLIYDRRVTAPAQMPAAQSLRVEEAAARRVRVVFLSPAVFKLETAPTFDPRDFAERFFEHSVGRAAQMYWACSGERLPWTKSPEVEIRLAGHRLYRYELPRHSFRQDKWLEFDGVVGYLDLEGDLGQVMPWAQAAEVFHFGQKAAFGLGKVRVLTIE